MRRFAVLAVLIAALVLAMPAAAFAADYYVAVGGSDTIHSGLQGSPFATVQKAVDAAVASGGGTVFVGPGTFTGNVTLKNNVSLYGAGASETTLTVTSGSVITINGIGSGETISGFSITGGSAALGAGIYCTNSSPTIADNIITANTAGGPFASYAYGGAMYCQMGSPTLRNNLITGNVASSTSSRGGAVYFSYASPTLLNNTITGNRAQGPTDTGYSGGGAIYGYGGTLTITGNLIADNVASGMSCYGGAIAVEAATLQLAGNTISGNGAMGPDEGGYGHGGAVYMHRVSGTLTRNSFTGNTANGESAEGGAIHFNAIWDPYTPTISANVISGNVADGNGGGASGGAISTADGSPRILGNLIIGNVAQASGAQGGALFCSAFWDDYPSIPLIKNNVVSGNSIITAWGAGGAAAFFDSSPAQLVNNTIVGNTASTGVGGIATDDFWGLGRPSISNCIMWGNSGAEVSGAGITYSDVDGGAGGVGNIAADPLFADAAAGDYRLLAGSPASDVATDTQAPADDIRGVVRPQGAGFDMGAHEYVPPVEPLPVTTPDAYVTSEDEALVIFGQGVLANDTVLVDDGPLSASLVSGPSNGTLTLDASGAFIYTPDAEWSGTDTFTYSATDANGRSADEVVSIAVMLVADPPVLAPIGSKSVDERASAVFTASATDVDSPSAVPVFSLGAGAPAGASIGADTGAFTWTPTEAQGPGVYLIDVIVTMDGLRASEIVTITVAEVNTAPVLASIGNKSVDELATLAFTASATDEDLPANTLTYALVGAPAGATIDPATGAFSWTPTEAQGPGSYDIDVQVSDGVGTDAETITVTVGEVNVGPVLAAIGNQSVDEQTTLSLTASATDADLPANTLTFSLSAAPAGCTIDAATGAFSWTPTEAQGPGTHTVTVTVSDGALSDTTSFDVTVAEVNRAPVLDAIGDKSVDELVALAFAASASDVDLPANALAFSLGAGAPAGAAIDPATGAFTWTPGEADGPGTYDVTVVVSDGALTDSETVTVTVADVNEAPSLGTIGAKSVNELAALAFTASASDADLPANTLTFSLGSGAPAGAAIDAATGAFSWTPSEAQGPGTHEIKVVVSDGVATDFEIVTVTVAEVATAPVLAPIGNKSVKELTKLTFTAQGSDADLPAETLTYRLGAGAPAGAAIDSATGVFSWTPTEAQGPGSYPITITVSDGVLAASETITVTVAEVTPPAAPAETSDEAEQPASGEPTAAPAPADTPEEAVEELLEGDDEVTGEQVSEGEAGEDEEFAFPWWILLLVSVVGGLGMLIAVLRRRKAKE